MERWFSTDYSTTVCWNLMIRSADPAWNFDFDRIKEKKCDKGGKNESLFFLQIFIKGVQTLRMDLRPVHVRDGHHDVVSRPDNLDFLCSRFQHPMCLNLKTLLRIGSLLPNPLLFSTWGTHHSVLGALGAVLVIPLDEVHEIFDTRELPFVWWTAVHQLRANLNLMAFILSKLTS